LPINLPTALQLANVRPLDVAVAAQRIRQSYADLKRARVLWLPSVYLGFDYFRHDGQLQDVAGKVFGTSKSSIMLGAGPSAVFAVSDAIFAPLAARQVVQARRAALQTATNDSLLAVAEAYFTVQQARGELAGAEDVLRRVNEVVRKTEDLVPGGLAPPVEVSRVRTELARRRQFVQSTRERWRIASAELNRLLRLDAAALVDPLEPPHLRVDLIDPLQPVEDLLTVALTNRPELATQQALVQATLMQLRQERWRPLIPGVLLRGNATNPAGLLSGGLFGGGVNDDLARFSARNSIDVQLLWEWQNLGFGNRARVQERKAALEIAQLEQLRVQDRVAADVVQAQAAVQSAAVRLHDAEEGVKQAVDSAQKNFQTLGTTRPAGDLRVLVIRPQEAVASLQALGQAYADYYSAVADYNRGQFRLYRALGAPAQLVGGLDCCPPEPDVLVLPPLPARIPQ
jgi:outer membrane protein TolC